MTTYRRNLALTIEGMGSSTSSTAGIAWHYGKATIGTPGDYEWLGGTGSREGLIRPPDSVACSVDAFECQMSGNAHSFELHASKLAKSLFFGRPEKPRDILSTALTEDATTVIMTGDIYTWSASDDGTVVWIGDEAILLGTHDAGATFTGCTRGLWGTTAMVQPSGMNVYDRSPKLVNRLAKILVYDRDAGTTTQAWQGFVRRFSVDNAIIRLDCQDIWSAVAGAKVNRKPSRLKVINGRVNQQEQSIRNGGIGKLDVGPQRVHKTSAGYPYWMSVQAANSLMYASRTGVNADWSDDTTSRSRAQMGSSVEPEIVSVNEVDAWEVLTVDRFRDQTGGTNAATADMRSSSRYLDEPFHPVSISMAILTSSYAAFEEAAAEEDMTGKTVINDASDTITFETVAADTNTVLFLAGQQEFPGLKDYAGTYSDNDLCDVTALEASEQRGMYTGNARLTAGYPYAAALQLGAEGVWRVMFRTTSAFDGSSAINLFDFGGSGETEAVNFLSNFNITLAEEVSWLTEDGAGTNHEAKWLIPGQLQPSTEYLFEVRRTSANVVSVYMNGVQLKHLTGTTSVTDNADGTITDVTSGGGSGVLCYDGLGADSTLDVYFLHICDDVTGTDAAATYATGKRVLTTAESDWLQRDNFTSIAADGDIVVAFRPDASDTLTDVTGTITTWDTATGDTLQLLGSQYWTEGSSGYWEESIAATRLTGDLTLNVLAMASADNDTGAWVAQNGANGDGVAAENILYRLQMSSSTALQYFAESGTGTDITVTWTVDAWTAGEIREYRLVREDDGGGGHDVRAYERKLPATSWTQLTVATSTGTGVGTTEANVGQPTGGGSSVHRIGRGYATDTATPFWLREVSVYDAAKNPS